MVIYVQEKKKIYVKIKNHVLTSSCPPKLKSL